MVVWRVEDTKQPLLIFGRQKHLRNPSSELLCLTHPAEPHIFPSGARIPRRVMTSLYSPASLRAAESEIQDQEGMLFPSTAGYNYLAQSLQNTFCLVK